MTTEQRAHLLLALLILLVLGSSCAGLVAAFTVP